MMRVLMFGIYDPAYSRNRVILRGMREAGVEIAECRVRPGRFAWAQLAWHYLRQRSGFDVLFVAFPGQEVMLLARLLTRRPIVFDAFTSHYEGYVQDRKTVRPSSPQAWWYRWLDRSACTLATICLTDTAAHANWFAHEYGLDRKKFHPVFVGTDVDVFKPSPEPEGRFTVHFHGTVIPLQGVPYILQAANILEAEGVRMRLIGPREPKVSYRDLAEQMARAHVCLGIFGDTPKTQRVIPNKVFEALACGRAVITADTPAVRELLDDTSAMLIPAADADAIVSAVRRLRDDPELRRSLAKNGLDVLKQRATPAIVGQWIKRIITEHALRTG